ncbi:MAG: helix-turn-helix transcriptional regulator, partial [Gammaproteobacteria bacterium]|nr:helix-turn-helix transcriptional regulator [Gammaproteobacteria bacterium]
MNNKNSVIDRLHQLMVESGLSDKNFKNTLASITGKTPRTIRRWYSLENNIHETDIERIAKYFGKHVHWLRYGDRRQVSTAVDQIMTSDHFGAIILKDDRVEEVNFKFLDMMKLTDANIVKEHLCDHILQSQSNETIQQCKLSQDHAITHGAHVDQMIMLLGDNKR